MEKMKKKKSISNAESLREWFLKKQSKQLPDPRDLLIKRLEQALG